MLVCNPIVFGGHNVYTRAEKWKTLQECFWVSTCTCIYKRVWYCLNCHQSSQVNNQHLSQEFTRRVMHVPPMHHGHGYASGSIHVRVRVKRRVLEWYSIYIQFSLNCCCCCITHVLTLLCCLLSIFESNAISRWCREHWMHLIRKVNIICVLCICEFVYLFICAFVYLCIKVFVFVYLPFVYF